MKMGHTPGPWSQDSTFPYEVWAATRTRRPVASVQSDGEHRASFTGEDYANMRLIAAAPDLLAACRAAKDVIGQHAARFDSEAFNADRQAFHALRKAIAKAERGIG